MYSEPRKKVLESKGKLLSNQVHMMTEMNPCPCPPLGQPEAPNLGITSQSRPSPVPQVNTDSVWLPRLTLHLSAGCSQKQSPGADRLWFHLAGIVHLYTIISHSWIQAFKKKKKVTFRNRVDGWRRWDITRE